MRVLVPGGAGYIGSFTVRALQQAGHEVVVFDNLSFGHTRAVDAEIVRGDLADSAALDACMARRGFEAIIHFAAFIEAGESMVEAGRFFANNTANAINLLNAAARHGIGQFVFSSTAGLYGNPEHLPVRESDATVPTNVYAESKLLVERMLPWYELVHGIRSVPLRYFNAAGAALDGSMGQDHVPASHLITIAIQTAMGQRDRFILFGDDYPTKDGTCIRDYIHVLDLAPAHLKALDYLAGGGTFDIFNVGTGTGYSCWDVINAVKRTSGVDFTVEIGPRREGDPVALIADASKLRTQLGWQPEYSDLTTIVDSSWEWHHTHPHGYET
jgi:UDP-glucose 4-epimerase